MLCSLCGYKLSYEHWERHARRKHKANVTAATKRVVHSALPPLDARLPLPDDDRPIQGIRTEDGFICACGKIVTTLSSKRMHTHRDNHSVVEWSPCQAQVLGESIRMRKVQINQPEATLVNQHDQQAGMVEFLQSVSNARRAVHQGVAHASPPPPPPPGLAREPQDDVEEERAADDEDDTVDEMEQHAFVRFAGWVDTLSLTLTADTIRQLVVCDPKHDDDKTIIEAAKSFIDEACRTINVNAFAR